MYKLWQTTHRETNKDTTISYEWLYHHILEPELSSITIYQHKNWPLMWLEITPPAGINIITSNGKIHPKFNSEEDAKKALNIVKELLK